MQRSHGLERRRRTVVRLATIVGAVAVSFAALQWLLVPLLAGGGGGASPSQLP